MTNPPPQCSSPADRLAGAGALIAFFAGAGSVGVVGALLEMGWIPVVYWGGSVTIAVTLAGIALFWVADSWNRRVVDRYQAWRRSNDPKIRLRPRPRQIHAPFNSRDNLNEEGTS